mmetsp:Transcript_41420/g.81196  ORF Transcript_41420/g.81196 Transcript_41420/m.81196 type:complete len:338 (+) Transcript_41420:209-1222(+)|eukprot:CAMPEP_0175162662 /NCGR_PEP_ID=MMETSP0087-20121206/25276_1 /TAXON_ID=136419 /ORGANISM="Unknown Unknown, Strain D1" /LENGTH=337 /DNA_ID=CAMNT_0016451195 /DNA_START=211 /DNA_END=1224 /DNA_ORIENTATION=+
MCFGMRLVRKFSSVTVPVVDIAKSFHHGSEAKVVAANLRDAAESTGFMYITGHGVTEETSSNAYEALRRFFALPLEQKMRYHASKAGGLRGYIGMYEQGNYGIDESDLRQGETQKEDALLDAKELYSFGPDLPTDHPDYHPMLFAPNVWPTAIDTTFQAPIEAYYKAVHNLSKHMFSLFARSLGRAPDFFEPHITHGMNSLNCIHYPPMAANAPPRQLGIGEHTDFECFTLLSQDETKGLEILTADKQWISVPPKPNHFVVNIGDMMARWTNNHFRSTVHRAANRETDAHRYAMAYFCCCNYSTTISSLMEGEPAKYKEVVAGEHLVARVSAANTVQ